MQITELNNLSYGKWVYYFINKTTKDRVTDIKELESNGATCFRIPWPYELNYPDYALKWYRLEEKA